ncbi:PfkB family carbohydrate kinase-like protein [Microthyrium microscopicum]|uniref:PfkB family carbohydrate kinase-like protein n=1 Tax=Microthyrium microscopicum TaxID=703497 RepID=A0A6A6U2V1_9PEZI|nr:PfkB family carbohydrate kinase-like protein [Microthyrium microscopicum]
MASTIIDSEDVDFVTLGMFIIDEIHFPAPRPSVYDVLGGAGSYSALGARLFSPPPLSKSVGWIVDCGSDFPKNIRDTIDSWKTSCLLRETPERLTTRGWNEYGDNDHRAFKYKTEKLRLTADSCSPQLIQAKSFHLICSPERCIDQVNGVLARRSHECPNLPKPIFLWEPVPDICTPEELENCRSALKLVDIVSPNHAEIAAYFGGTGQRGDSVDCESMELYAHNWLQSGIGKNGGGSVVIRCGKQGCFLANRGMGTWIPAVHDNSPDKVVDPTGGGNTFLGALGVALARGHDIKTASVWGSVAASFAIEQIGMPILEEREDGEVWNGESVQGRLDVFMNRLL